MTDKEKDNLRAVAGCSWLLAEILISTGIGGFFGWPMGFTVFGIALLIHTAHARRKMKRENML